MKVFIIYSNLYFKLLPPWLEGFRKEYDKPYAPHVTFKQPCFIEESKVEEVKAKLSEYVSSSSQHLVIVEFNELVIDAYEPEEICLMVQAKGDEVLTKIHDDVVSLFDEYRDYVKPLAAEWETNFMPHITIARDLTSERYAEALPKIPNPLFFTAEIRDLSVIVVDAYETEAIVNARDIFTFNFKTLS